jgi:hypothetical protein
MVTSEGSITPDLFEHLLLADNFDQQVSDAATDDSLSCRSEYSDALSEGYLTNQGFSTLLQAFDSKPRANLAQLSLP